MPKRTTSSVHDFFWYNEETDTSVCVHCGKAARGKHAGNLRKHLHTHKEILGELEKKELQRRREYSPLSGAFTYKSEDSPPASTSDMDNGYHFMERDNSCLESPLNRSFGPFGGLFEDPKKLIDAFRYPGMLNVPPVLVDDLEDEVSNSVEQSSPTPDHSMAGPYLLKKETHCNSVLEQLMKDDVYSDVTLTAEGQHIKAHKIVLCMASSYFRQVLSKERGVQSIVILRDVKLSELRNILNFVYTGEATVDAADLESFMRTAELLEITSLCEGQKSIGAKVPPGIFGSSPTKPRESSTKSSFKRHTSSETSHAAPSKFSKISDTPASPEPDDHSPSMTFVKEEPTDMDLDARGSNSNSDSPDESVNENSLTPTKKISVTPIELLEESDALEDPGPTIDDIEESESLEIEVDPYPDPIPKRCPYCPHLEEDLQGVSMLSHLLVAHSRKPAFPCERCWKVFVQKLKLKRHYSSCSGEEQSV